MIEKDLFLGLDESESVLNCEVLSDTVNDFRLEINRFPNIYKALDPINVCPWMKKEDVDVHREFKKDEVDETLDKGNLLEVDNEVNISKLYGTRRNAEHITLRIRTSDVKPNSGAHFKNFNINPSILLALNEQGWNWPSPIQEATIMKINEGKNIIARSKNGTGKTGAYLIGALNKIDSKKKVQVIILVPTRELALQTANFCISLSKYLEIQVMMSTGGTNLPEDIYRLSRSVHVIVGTPGRIYDLIYFNKDVFCDVKCLVLDEADKLMSTDFQVIIEKIINTFPLTCQKLFFSATYPFSIKPFIDKYCEDCEYCNVMNELPLKGVTQYYAYLDENQKLSCLKILMEKLEIHQAIIFCNSVKRVELLAKHITEIGYSTYYIHAQMSQEARNRVFHDFREGFVTYMVCTDIMARGIDISTVNVVFNFDCPKLNELFLHRTGRCGRFGHLGISISFITEKDKERMVSLERELDIKVYAIPRDIDKRLYVSTYQTSTQFEISDCI